MSLLECLERARHDEAIARLRRLMSVRAMVATGMSQRAIARGLGVSQPAVSQLLRASECVTAVSPDEALEAAVPVLKDVASQRGFRDLAVFGSIARGEAGLDSDIDLIVLPPKGTQISDLLALAEAFSSIVGHHVDVMTYGGLKPRVDDDIRRDMVPL
jgi:uncharacterized protein